jgi:WD40 repeat protein
MSQTKMRLLDDVDVITYGIIDRETNDSKTVIIHDKLADTMRGEGVVRFVLSGSDAGVIRVWDLNSKQTTVTLQGKQEKVCVVLHLVGSIIAAGTESGIVFWDFIKSPTKPIRHLLCHSSYVTALIKLKSGDIVSGAGVRDGSVRVWKYPEYETATVLKGDTASGIKCIVAINNSMIASGSDGTASAVRVWDLCTNECIHVLKGHDGSVNCLCYTRKGELLSGGDDYDIRVWDLETGECTRVICSQQGWVYSILECKDGHILSCGQYNRLAAMWDISTGKCVKSLSLQHRGIYISFVNEIGVSGMVPLSDYRIARR